MANKSLSVNSTWLLIRGGFPKDFGALAYAAALDSAVGMNDSIVAPDTGAGKTGPWAVYCIHSSNSQAYQNADTQLQGASGGGGGGGAGPSGGTMNAVQVGTGHISGGLGARGVSGPGAQQRSSLARTRTSEFTGLDLLSPPTKLAPQASPYMKNWNTIEVPGSISVRRGTMKLNDNRNTVASGALGAGYLGLGLLNIPPNDYSGSGALMLAFSDSQTYAGSASPKYYVCDSGPTFCKPKLLRDRPAPTLTLSNPSAGALRAVVGYANLRAENSVEAWVVRYSSTRQPRDIDGYDDSASSILGTADYAASQAATTQYDETGLDAGNYYVTAWPVGRLGVGEPKYDQLTIS